MGDVGAATAIVQALRGAANATAQAKALDAAAELLVSTPSLATTQLIVIELTRLSSDQVSSTSQPLLSRQDVLTRLKQAAAVCQSPANKAEYLGFALTQQLFNCLEDPAQRMQKCQETLIDVFNGNPHVLSGVLAAVQSKHSPLVKGSPDGALLALQAISPLIVRIFIGVDESCQKKLTLLHALQRVAWQSHDARVSDAVTHTLVTALMRSPRSVDAVESFTALVAAVVDLLTALEETTVESTHTIERVSELLIARIRLFVTHDIGALQLLQSLVQLAAFAPDALWRSHWLFACAHVLLTACAAPVEKQLLLEAIAPVLACGCEQSDDRATRSVYVECLVVPLISVLSTHAETARPLLQRVMHVRAHTRFAPATDAVVCNTNNSVIEDDETMHLHAMLRLVLSDSATCERYLSTLFVDASTPNDKRNANSEESWRALLLGTLLFDERRVLRDAAIAALERQVRAEPKFWSAASTKLLVSTLVFLASHRPTTATPHFATFVTRSLYVLASLAAGTTDTMKIVLRLIKSMSAVASTRAVALRLLFVVWERESRVFPRLEAMLHDDSVESDAAYDVVQVATIASLCERDPELGVDFVRPIQTFLEDTRVTVAAMALNAIASLCRADVLDFYAAFKILSLKMKKKKIACVDDALFLERLCVFYALGGAVEIEANKRLADKLLAHLWELTESDVASVRGLAFEALNAFSLQTLGLCVIETRTTASNRASNDDDDDDDDAITEDDVSNKLEELVNALQSEDADAVRVQIEALLTRVLAFESAKLTAGGGRSQTIVSSTVDDQRLQQRVSAAATKEIAKKFPSRREVMERYASSDVQSPSTYDAFLLAFEAKEPVEYSSVKRRDRQVKIATLNVVDMDTKFATVLANQAAPWTTSSAADVVFLRVQSVAEGWQAFMATYVDAVDELSSLKLTIGANPDDGDAFFVDHINKTLATLQATDTASDRELLVLVAVGALVGQLRDSTRRASPRVVQCVREQVERLSSRLKRAIEEARVFAPERQRYTSVASAVVALHLSLGHRAFDATHERSLEAHLASIEPVLLALLHASNHALVQAVAATAVSHWGWLCASAVAVDADRLAATQKRVETIARAVFSLSLRSIVPSESVCRSIVDRVFAHEQVGSIDASALATAAPPAEIVALWGSLMGLTRVSSGFAHIQRTQWLTNVRDVLHQLWQQRAAPSIVGVALGPVVLECIRLHLSPAAEAETFVQTSIARLESSTSALDRSFQALAAYSTLCHMPSLGCAVSQAQLHALIDVTHATIRADAQSPLARDLALAGVANYFQCSLGMCALGFGPTRRRDAASIQLTTEPSDVETLVTCVRTCASDANSDFAQFVLGAIAVANQLFFVAQKKRSFDNEIASLPNKSLLSKSMELLRRAQSATSNDDNARARVVRSLLACLAATSATLPLLDFESLVHRLVTRFCDVDVTIACVQFALMQGICDQYVVTQWLTREVFAILPSRIQSALVTGIALLATRVASDTLARILTTASDVVLDTWRCGFVSLQQRDVVGVWIEALGAMLQLDDTSARIASESRDVVQRVVVQQILPHFPSASSSDVDSVQLVRRFASNVLARIPRQDGVEAYVLSSSSTHGAQHAAVLAELLHAGTVFPADRYTAIVVQWIVRQDFAQWTHASAATRAQLLHELAACVSLTGPDGKLSQDPISWLLEVIQAFSSAVTACSIATEATEATRHALFTFVVGVCGWMRSLSFEHHVALHAASSDSSAISPFVSVFAVGLVRAFGASESLRAVVEQLWSLQTQVERASTELGADMIDYNAALRTFALHAHVVAGARATTTVKDSLVHFWSLDGFQ